MTTNDHTENQFFHALKELQIAKLLRKANITKSCGVSAYEVFQFLLLLVFQGKNLFRLLNSKHKEQAVSKNTYYRFLNEASYNWSRFLMLLAVKVASAFDRLTRPEKVNVLILVDSVIKRNRSKKVELLARVYDHVERFNLLSSASESNRYNEVSDSIDHRTNGYKFRKSSMMHKTDAAIQLIRNALTAGIKADYVLMDTWFTTEPILKNILDTGIHAIGMVKQLQQRYTYNDRQYTLPGLKNSLIFPVPEISLVPLLSQPKPGLRLRLYLYATVIKKVNVSIF